jgi:DNA ligase-1
LRRFVQLYETLDRTTSTNAKVTAMEAYFRAAPPGDAAWALFFLTQRKIKRLLPSRVLWDLTLELTGLPAWLLEHSYAEVGDAAELVALLVDRPAAAEPAPDVYLEQWVRERILPLKDMDLGAQAAAMRGHWSALDTSGIFVLNKIITGEFRVGASATLAVRALARAAGVPPATMAHRVMGDWTPSAEFFRALLAPETAQAPDSRPYPFFLASPLEADPATLGPREEWQAEWKWDGIRAQLVRRGEASYLWSRGEELVTERFPEIAGAALRLPAGTVLDGEILAYRGEVLPFSVLQTRIGRQKLGPAILQAAPAALMAYDLLEQEGRDVRAQPLSARRAGLEALLAAAGAPALLTSPIVAAASWSELAAARGEARARNVEGLMLKRLTSPVSGGPPARRLVEVEDRSLHDRRGAHVRAPRPRAPGHAAHRLHVRGLGPRGAGAGGQGVFGAVRPGDPRARRLDPAPHARAVRSGPRGGAVAGVRAGLRRHRPLQPAQGGGGRALPAHPPPAHGQAGGGSGHAGGRERAVASAVGARWLTIGAGAASCPEWPPSLCALPWDTRPR